MTTTHRLLLAARQRDWVLTTAELRTLGLTHAAIRRRVAAGVLHVVHPGVFAVGRAELAPNGRWSAAVRACGDDAALSHLDAAGLWGLLTPAPGPVHVTVPTQRGRDRRPGLVLHRCETLTPGQVTVRERIPVTTLGRVLRDVALPLTPRGLQRAVRNAVRLHGLDIVRLRAALADVPANAAREARLRRVLDRYVPGDAGEGLEEAFLDLCVRFDLPLPRTQLRIGSSLADFAWPALGLIVETDDRSHETVIARQDDRVRDRALKALGCEVLRFSWAEVNHQPHVVAAELRRAMARRRRELGLAA